MHRGAIAEARDLLRRRVGKVSHKVCLQYEASKSVLTSKLPKDRAELVLVAVLHAGETFSGWELNFGEAPSPQSPGVP